MIGRRVGRRIAQLVCLGVSWCVWVTSGRAAPVADSTPPTITASVSPAPNPNGWHRGNVTVRFTCADAQSGIAFCPGAVFVTTEGAQQVIERTARDRAGNTATARVTLNIDKHKPAIAVTLSPDPVGGLRLAPVTARFTCSDSLSRVAVCPPDQVLSHQGADQMVTGRA